MKFTKIALVLGTATSLVSAQSACSAAVSAVPACGTSCISSAASAAGCAPTNYACECAPATFTSIQNAAVLCVLGACGLTTATQVLSSVSAVCTACV
ncbi:Extracellular membrane CFEM domain protein [Rutstroemia sp. NJR-2017a BVV2]|nr:Extracellular membrane CFEM domain protein [Rutstroemia sp. NJR-2017a BVV2]PQE25208.1 Extracellular membrane CFEM domain protein [Rutstroemia sp. NJR-2017a BVV2]